MSVQFQDYYQTLGVSRTASPEEISKAYRKLARKYHPDVNKNKGAEDKFKELNEAHEVLKNPESRKRYDALGANWKAGQQFTPPPDFDDFAHTFGGRNPFGSRAEGRGSFGDGGFQFESRGGGLGGFSDFFNALFGEANFGGAGSGGQTFGRRPDPAADGSHAEASLTLSLEEVYRGGTKTISLDVVDYLPDGTPHQEKKVLQVKIPAGITDGKVIRLSGQGSKGAGGGKPGDLLLKLQFAKHPAFWTEGHTVLTKLNIAPWEAALGAKLEVQTLDGSVTLQVPPGAQSGQSLRLRGKGLRIDNSQRADMLVQLSIAVPKKMTDRERELFEALKNESKFNPRTVK